MNPNPNENQKVNKSGSSRLHETNTQSLEKSLTTLSWLVTVNVDELRRKHEREDKVDNFGNKKPSHSYADLIRMAITSTPQERMTLSEIYEFVENKFPYYKSVGGGWKNSIRHNLSLNVVFQKLPRPRDEPGKGSYWIINPNPPKPENFRNHSNRKRTSESKSEVQSSKRPSIEDLNSVNYQDIYESLFKPHSNMTGQTSLPSVGSFSTNQNQMSPSSTSVTSNESGSNQSVRAFPTQQLPHPLQRPNQYNQACSSTQQIQQNSQSDGKPDTHKQLCRLSSDPLQWSIDHLRLSEASMRNNPEFQHILSQLKSAESQNWEIDEKSRTSLAFSLSQFMFKQNESSNAESDDDVNGFEDINGGEIDYVKLAQL